MWSRRVEIARLSLPESQARHQNQALPDHQARVAARERILRLLCQRPLRWAEMQDALGLLTNEARFACEWLMDHGYIAPMTLVRGAAQSADALWTLGDRGRAWALRNGALVRESSHTAN